MRVLSFNILFAVCALFVGCAAHPKQATLSWLEGRWFSVDMQTVEEWKYEGGEWKGATIRLKGNEIVETMRLYPHGKHWAFDALVSGQNGGKAVTFKVAYMGADSLHVVNPDHDFPRHIIYKNLGRGRLETIIYNDYAERISQVLYKDGLRQQKQKGNKPHK